MVEKTHGRPMVGSPLSATWIPRFFVVLFSADRGWFSPNPRLGPMSEMAGEHWTLKEVQDWDNNRRPRSLHDPLPKIVFCSLGFVFDKFSNRSILSLALLKQSLGL